MRPSRPRVCLCKLQQTCIPGSSGPVRQVRRPGHHHPGHGTVLVCVCVPRAVHTHDSLRIFEASSCGHMFNMSSSQVTNGNGAMPAFGEKLGPDDIEAGMQVQRRFFQGVWLRRAMIFKSSLCCPCCLAPFSYDLVHPAGRGQLRLQQG